VSECQTSYIEHVASKSDNRDVDAAGRSDAVQTECH